jgi:hypothetical protein
VVLLVGATLMVVGAVLLGQRQGELTRAREVTAADLAKADAPAALPGWISHAPDRWLETGVQYVKLRSRQTTSRFILVPVEDRWLLTKVDGNFNGVRLEGQLGEFDAVALPMVRSALPAEGGRLLPYQLDAEYDIAARRRQEYLQGGTVAGFGLLLVCCAVGGLRANRSPFRGARDGGRSGFAASEPGSASEHPSRRSWAVRAFFGVLWAVVLFLVAAVAAALLTTMGAGDDPGIRKRLAEESGRKLGPGLLLGSFALATVLTGLGRLPGTRR